MKKFIVLLLVALFNLSACKKDFIDLAPPSNLNSNTFYKSQQDMNQATLSAYGNLRTLYNSTYIRIGEIRSDNTTYSWLSGNPANEKGIDEFASPLLPENNFVTELWDNSYKTILRCNIVIDRTPAVTFTDEKLKAQYMAEARFLRALVYFWLNRAFGGFAADGQLLGPIKVDKEVTQAEAYTMGRAPLAEMYDFIVEDLKFAEANLPQTYGGIDKGRVTKGGATALLGKVYLTMAGFPLNKGTEYYNLASTKLQEVVNNGSYSLVPSYKDLFDVSKKNSTESLFEVQYLKGSPNNATGSPWNNNFAPRFSDKEVVLVGDKGGENSPTAYLSKAYETGDPRKYISMRDGWVNARTNIFQNERYVCKYYDIATSGSDNGNNWIELRLGDVYLMYAEALVRGGGSHATALVYLNKIRERARNTAGDPQIQPPAALLRNYLISDFSTDDALLSAIEQERRIELAFENHRWFDLIRTGRAKDVMIEEQAFDGYNNFVWSDNALFYPIPMTVMQSNPQKIMQNKGYTQM